MANETRQSFMALGGIIVLGAAIYLGYHLWTHRQPAPGGDETNAVEDAVDADAVVDAEGEEGGEEPVGPDTPEPSADTAFAFKHAPATTESHAQALGRFDNLGFKTSGSVRVGTIQEFIKALGSNRVITVAEGRYIFKDSNQLGGDAAKAGLEPLQELSEFYDDTTIHDIDNLTIIGEGAGATFIQPDGYNHVLKFRNVKNLLLYNLVLGHHPEQGYCMGGVLLVENGRNVRIERTTLFGSGTEGLSLVTVEGLVMHNSVITQCTEQLSTFAHVRGVVIEDSVLADNGPSLLRGFGVYKAEVEFRNVRIFNNGITLITRTDDTYGVMFTVDGYDYGEWFVSSPKTLEPPVKKSRITFKDTTINGKALAGELKYPKSAN